MITKSYVDLFVFLLLKYYNITENNSGKKIIKKMAQRALERSTKTEDF